jgi:hypothetical protein
MLNLLSISLLARWPTPSAVIGSVVITVADLGANVLRRWAWARKHRQTADGEWPFLALCGPAGFHLLWLQWALTGQLLFRCRRL